jgi:phosphate-selective porin
MTPRHPLSAVLLLLAAPLAAQTPAAPPAVRLSGYIQARETYQDGIGLTGTINRARLAAGGSVQRDITWRIQGEFRTGNVGTGRASVSLQDAFVRWTRGGLGIQAGQFKTPFSREFITSLTEVETADRATVVDSLAPKRDIGLMADYALGGRGTLAVGVFNGNGQNVTGNADSALLGVARVTVRPHTLVSLGVNVARYFADSTRYGADANLEAPWLVLRAEIAAQHRDVGEGEDDWGWFLLAAAPVRPWLQPIAKFEWFDRPSLLDGSQRNRAWTVGANLYPWGRSARFTLEYLSRRVGSTGDRRGLALAQAQVTF